MKRFRSTRCVNSIWLVAASVLRSEGNGVIGSDKLSVLFLAKTGKYMAPVERGPRLRHSISTIRSTKKSIFELRNGCNMRHLLRSVDLWIKGCVKSRAFLLRRCACFPSPSACARASQRTVLSTNTSSSVNISRNSAYST